MATKIMMPRLGESVIEGTVSSWLKGEGDQVEQYEPILEIETDKVTTEAIAEVSGTILKILVPQGETVAVGTVLALIGEPGEAMQDAGDVAPVISETETAAIEQVSTDSALSPAVAKTVQSNGPPLTQRPYSGRISPVVGRIAGEHKVDLTMVPGSGRQGRITKKDILAYIESRDAGAPLRATDKAPTSGKQAPVSKLIPGQLLPMTGIRRAIAEHMVRSKRTSPHVTTVFDLDFTAVTAHRSANKKRFALDGVNLTFTSYIMAAIVQGLIRHPLVNSSWNDGGINLKKEINLGMATAIPDGLIVPVIKNADGLDLLALARAINDLSDRARRGRLLPDEVQNGTFTLTNHGVSGSLFATPIINQPQCGILGVGKIEKRVKVINDAIAIRPMAFASLTFDHRILDGLSADGFMATVKDVIENWS